MTEKKNKYGLSSYIPSKIRRKIRQHCGFGCIICGNAIIDYEHVDPVFAEARCHDPDKMTLLCPNHHARVTRGSLSKDTIKEHMKNPFCKRVGSYYVHPFDIGNQIPKVIMGKAIFINTTEILNINNTSILAFNPPDYQSNFFRVSGLFFNKDGNRIVEIKENEFYGSTNSWDSEIKGRTITIRYKNGDIALKLSTNPPNEIFIEKIDMYYEDHRIFGDKNSSFKISTSRIGCFRVVDSTFSSAITLLNGKLRTGR